jgi:putative hydrolase of the HAD superfamily
VVSRSSHDGYARAARRSTANDRGKRIGFAHRSECRIVPATMPRLELLCFDLDDTLWHVEPVLVRAERETWQWLIGRVPDLARYCTAADVRAQRTTLLRNRPEYQHDLTALRRDAMRHTLRAAGVAADEAARIAADAMEIFLELRCQVEFFPGVLATLERLGERYKLAALSNGNADLARTGAAALFDVVLSAASVGRAKPDPAMFQRALAEAGVAASRAVHIGDHPEHDVRAARAAGLHAIWANPLALPRPDGLPADVPTLEDFATLATLLLRLESRLGGASPQG